jgi:hypothetical protein
VLVELAPCHVTVTVLEHACTWTPVQLVVVSGPITARYVCAAALSSITVLLQVVPLSHEAIFVPFVISRMPMKYGVGPIF